MTKSRHILPPRRYWTEAETALLRELYADTPTHDIAARVGRSVQIIYAKASSMGLVKSEAYLASPDACRLRRGDNVGAKTRFKPGQVSWNKGTHFTAGGRSHETRFKKGTRPHTWVPVGSYRVNADGYMDRKVTDTGYPPRDWVGMHRLVWIDAHGPIPKNHVVCFKPGRHSSRLEDITPDALELLSRAELMARNTVHNLPKPLAQLVQLRGAINRKINDRIRAREK